MDWWTLATHWTAWLFGFAVGAFWAARRRSHMDLEQALNVVWCHYCPDKREPEVNA